PVFIEQVRVDGRAMPQRGGAAVHLAAGQRSFEVEYTALSFLAPERVRFRYRLDGYDDAWQEVSRRTAFYTRVPPGRYTFRVMASNDSGVWNETGASLALVVAPFFYETAWFRALLGLAVLGLGVAAL